MRSFICELNKSFQDHTSLHTDFPFLLKTFEACQLTPQRYRYSCMGNITKSTKIKFATKREDRYLLLQLISSGTTI